MPADQVLSVHDVNNIYHVPLLLIEQNLHNIISRELKLTFPVSSPEISAWSRMAHSVDEFETKCKIALIGKYCGLQDSYLSVIKALKHASIRCERDLELCWIEADELCDPAHEAWDIVKSCDGVIVPGGFGLRGVEGKILAANYCRENKIPYLGVCLGFQVMVMEYSRNVLGWEGAISEEFDEKAEHKVVIFMPEIDKETMGGTMRLGARDTIFLNHSDTGERSTASYLYGRTDKVSERHRHRYEVNPEKIDAIDAAGLHFVGKDDAGERMEIAELPRKEHPFYLGCQYHPEFQSRPLNPSPVFLGLLMAASGQLDAFLEKEKK